jgi:hypothetical protein
MKYQVLLEGRNLWVHVDGNPSRLGFFATRVIEAAAADGAAQEAIALVKADLWSNLLNDDRDPAVLLVDEVVPVVSFPADVSVPGAGYTWYPDTDRPE